MGEAAKAIGAPLEVNYRGKTYRVAAATMELLGLMEARLQRRTIEAVERMRSDLPETTFAEWRDAAIALIAAGHFSFGSKALADWSFSPEGMQYEAYLKLKAGAETSEDRAEITEEFAAELWNECKNQLMTLMQADSAVDPTKAPPENGAGQAKA